MPRVQDMDLARPHALDNRCLEMVTDGLLLYQGAQLAVDTTLVSVLRRDGFPRQRSTTLDGATLIASPCVSVTDVPVSPSSIGVLGEDFVSGSVESQSFSHCRKRQA